MIKYRTDARWGVRARIESVEVVRETESSVWLGNGRRSAKDGSSKYHDTWEAARAYLIERAHDQLSIAMNGLKRAQDQLGKVKGMKP